MQLERHGEPRRERLRRPAGEEARELGVVAVMELEEALDRARLGVLAAADDRVDRLRRVVGVLPVRVGSAAVPSWSERIISPTPGRITPPLKSPAAFTKSMVVAVPHTTTSTGRPSTSARAPIIAAQRSEPSCAGLR